MQSRYLCFSGCLFLLLLQLFPVFQADDVIVGTAARYGPPYSPTACFGNDEGQFPSSNFFASAGDGIWDNGASCGRLYLVRCISAEVQRTCVPNETIQIRIVDRANTSDSKPISRNATTMVLSTTAFGKIANLSATFINIEFQQV